VTPFRWIILVVVVFIKRSLVEAFFHVVFVASLRVTTSIPTMIPSWRWSIVVGQFEMVAISRGLPAQASSSPAITILAMRTVRWWLRRSFSFPIPLALPLVS